ncbi:MAG: iron-sulfur cluster assembly scaffold protein [Desulfobacterales bacterium]|nr:iron-sulfur cluster assembly scaffold protein [Desulfobacterales bacterium]
MNDSLDAFVQSLQSSIDEETKEDWGEIAFQRWKHPLFVGVLPSADGTGSLRGDCGDRITVYLKFDGSVVAKAAFQTDGCGPSLICGSFAAEKALGKTAEEILDITGEAILADVGGLPEDHEHCAFLAAASLRAAVDDHMARQIRQGRAQAE